MHLTAPRAAQSEESLLQVHLPLGVHLAPPHAPGPPCPRPSTGTLPSTPTRPSARTCPPRTPAPLPAGGRTGHRCGRLAPWKSPVSTGAKGDGGVSHSTCKMYRSSTTRVAIPRELDRGSGSPNGGDWGRALLRDRPPGQRECRHGWKRITRAAQRAGQRDGDRSGHQVLAGGSVSRDWELTVLGTTMTSAS